MKDALSLLIEIWHYLVIRRRWLIVTFVVFLLILAVLVTVADSPYLAPFVYSLF